MLRPNPLGVDWTQVRDIPARSRPARLAPGSANYVQINPAVPEAAG